MRRFYEAVLDMIALVIVVFAAAVAYGFIAPVGSGQIEGPNVPEGTYVAYSGHNCLPQSGDFARCLTYVRGPHNTEGEPANAGAGTQAYSACQYKESDPLPALPEGPWDTQGIECPASRGANCTGDLLGFRATGGDGGCWQRDSATGAFLVRTADVPVVRRGRCWFHADGRPPRCRWKTPK